VLVADEPLGGSPPHARPQEDGDGEGNRGGRAPPPSAAPRHRRTLRPGRPERGRWHEARDHVSYAVRGTMLRASPPLRVDARRVAREGGELGAARAGGRLVVGV